MLAFRNHDVLDEASLCTVMWIIPQELLIGKKFVLKTTDRVKTVN